jgi:hypothetical protein
MAALLRAVRQLRREAEAMVGTSLPDGLTEKDISRLRDPDCDLVTFAERCLKIRTKAGGIKPLVLNRPQTFLHERLEEQRRKTGKVRALILKGRQEGCSTYVEARFYKHVIQNHGVRAFILTHALDATSNLFEMAERYHEHCPGAIKSALGAANAKELHFPTLDSGYKVGTAGAKAVGRSSTIQLFHGSEVAFWPNAQEHAAGILEAIADAPGTEIILESTANGIGGFFHEKWQAAERGDGDFAAIFIPWFWMQDYTRPVPEGGLRLSAEDIEYQQAHGLTDEQMSWRQAKIGCTFRLRIVSMPVTANHCRRLRRRLLG